MQNSFREVADALVQNQKLRECKSNKSADWNALYISRASATRAASRVISTCSTRNADSVLAMGVTMGIGALFGTRYSPLPICRTVAGHEALPLRRIAFPLRFATME